MTAAWAGAAFALLAGCSIRISPGEPGDDHHAGADGGPGADGGGPGIVDPRPDAGPPPILSDSEFALAPLDTGNLLDACTMLAPGGTASWGLSAATFSDPDDRSIDTARFVARGVDAYLYAMEQTGRWGNARVVQGDVWGGGDCGPIEWRRFTPVAIAGRQLALAIDVVRDTDALFTTDDSSVMLAVNVWLSGADLPQAGGDVNGRKPLVVALVVHHECSTGSCALRSFEDADAYHHQAVVVDAPLTAGLKAGLAIDLDDHIGQALAALGLEAAAASLSIYQVEFVAEVHRAEGAATIDNFALSVE